MAKTYQPYDPKQSLILPPNLDDWLPDEHLARFVSDTIDAIDLSPIHAHYEREERGYPPYHPAMMTKLLVYGYCVNTRSSRKIEQACIDHVAFRWLAAGAQPKHSAINDYRAKHIGRLDHVFTQVLELAQGAGLVKLATVALDGTKIKANASIAKNRTLAQLDEEHERLRKQARKFLEESQAVDAAEDELYGKDVNPYSLPEGLRTKKQRMDRIRKAIQDLERERDHAQREYEKRLEDRKAKEDRTGKKLRGRKPKPPEPQP